MGTIEVKEGTKFEHQGKKYIIRAGGPVVGQDYLQAIVTTEKGSAMHVAIFSQDGKIIGKVSRI